MSSHDKATMTVEQDDPHHLTLERAVSEHGNPQVPVHTASSQEEDEEDAPAAVSLSESEKLCRTVTALALHEKEHALKVGILVHNPSLSDSQVRAIPSILSKCRLVAMTLLTDPTNSKDNQTAKLWLDQNASGYPMMHHIALDQSEQQDQEDAYFARPSQETLAFYHGSQGYADMLANPHVEAVYLLVPTAHQQHQLVLQALSASKHVLVHDPQSTTLADFQQQVQLARSVRRFIQFSTMFQQYTTCTTFLDSVAHLFGGNTNNSNNNNNTSMMHALFHLHPDDFYHCGVHHGAVLTEQDSCIRRLARYCVLCALLLLQQKGHSHPTAVQITDATVQSQSELYGKDDGVLLPLIITQASGTVWFTDDRLLTFTVGYSMTGRTRQVLEVHSPEKYATMNDFVIPHADGLANYRVYDKMANELHPTTHNHHHHHHHSQQAHSATSTTSTTTNPLTVDPDHEDRGIQVTGGDAIDVLSGPPSNVMTWRHFAQICRAVEEGEKDDLTEISIQLKGILNKLEESYKAGYVKMELEE